MDPGTADFDAGHGNAHECGLFVIWDAAAGHRQPMLADLQKRFEVQHVYEIHWSPSRIMQNFQRFYSDIDVRGVYHIFNKGSGPLTVVTVLDRQPLVELRETSRGMRAVNVRFLEAKQAYRNWTLGLEVHCGETPEENRRDAMMLLGTGIENCQASTARPWDGKVRRLGRDVQGADGWPSLADLFATLNQCARYAVLYARGCALDDFHATGHASIELMTDDFHAVHRILNARPAPQAAPHGGHFKVSIGGSRWRIAIRFPGDQYFDPAWAESMLRNRVYDQAGYYRLADDDWFDTLAYHALVHVPSPARFRRDLEAAAGHPGRNECPPDVVDNPQRAAAWLDRLLQQRGYRCYRPLDVTVMCRQPLPAGKRRHWSAGNAGYHARLAARAQRLTGAARSHWWYVRDRALLRLPRLRSLKRRLSRPASKPPAR